MPTEETLVLLNRAKGIRHRIGEKDKLSREDATVLIEEIKTRVQAVKDNVEIIQQDIIILWRNRGAEAVGAAGWEQLCRQEFGVTLPLTREDRNELARELLNSKMSTRAVGAALGVSKDTVQRAGVSSETPAENGESGTREGMDGKNYRLPPKPDLKATTHPVQPIKSTHHVMSVGPTNPQAEQESPTDRRDPFPQSFRSTMFEVIRVTGRIHKLLDDDRMSKYAEELAVGSLSDVERAISALEALSDALANSPARGGDQ